MDRSKLQNRLSVRSRRRSLSVALLGVALSLGAHAQTTFWNWEVPHVSPIAITPDGQSLLVVNTPGARVEVFDISGAHASAPKLLRSIATGLEPVSVRIRSIGGVTQAWVANHMSDSVTVIDVPTWRVARTILTGDEPADVAFSPIGGTGGSGRAFVTCSQANQVRVYDLGDLNAAPVTLPILGLDPRMLATSADGSKVYAAIFASGNGSTIVPHQMVSNPAGPYGGVNPPPNVGITFEPAQTPGLNPAPKVSQIVRKDASGVWRDDNNANWSPLITWDILDNDVAIIDASTLSVSYATGMLSSVMAVGMRPDGMVSVVGLDADNVRRFEHNLNGVFAKVKIGSFMPASPGTKSVADLNPHLTYATPTIAQAQRDLSVGDPRAIAWHPTLPIAFVAGMGSNNVIVTDDSGARLTQIEVGQGPTGVVLTADGARAYVMNKFDASVSTIDTASYTEVSRVAFIDPTPSVIRTGRPFLYDTHRTSGLGHLSCASCHIDGRSDHLAWDLGAPNGQMKAVNQTCINNQFCQPWHPMKGPMITQTLQGIIGVEPLHWRGDKANLTEFNVAYTNLQGDDAMPSNPEMTQFQNFVATIKYPPNPNRLITNLMPNSVPVTGGTGDPYAGQGIFNTFNILGNLKCVTCHSGPLGTSRIIDDALLSVEPQSMKMAQLRGLYERLGQDRSQPQSIRGFAFGHDGEFDTIFAAVQHSPDFTFSSGATGIQQRRDLEALMICWPGDTHPAVGQQICFDGSNNNDPAAIDRLNTFLNIAPGTTVSVIAKGRVGGVDRGYALLTGSNFQSDIRTQTTTATALRTAAAPGSEIVFTVVPFGQQTRLGVDRDLDTWFDQDELRVCSDPNDPSVFPGSRGSLDVDANLSVNVQDIFEFLNRWFTADPRADFDGLDGLTVQDVFAYLNAWFAGC